MSEFTFQDEGFDKEIMEVNTFEVEYDVDDLVDDVVFGLPAIREPPTKVLSKAEKMKWTSVSWLSSFSEMFKRN